MANLKHLKHKEMTDFIHTSIKAIPVQGVSLNITNQSKTIYSLQYGQGIDKDSSFVLGSTSKAITATSLLTLLEEHHISLDTPIKAYLAWIHTENSISILDLLNHTSGIATYETIEHLQYAGTYGVFEYSNANYNLLGKIMEKITGNSFSKTVEQTVFEKLKMAHSFSFTNATKQNVVRGYKSFFGVLIPYQEKVPQENSWIQAPSGYLCARPSDMAKYFRFLLQYTYGNQQLLQLVKKRGVSVRNDPAIEGIYGNSGIYSMGWVYKNVNGTEILYHTGKLSTYSSLSVIIPQKNIGISVMCNMGDFLVGTNLMEQLYEGIISITIGKAPPTIPANSYAKQHARINLALLIVFTLCLFPALRLLTKGGAFSVDAKTVCPFLLLHGLLPIAFLEFFAIFKIPDKVVADFAPDVFMVFRICAVTLFITGIWQCIVTAMGMDAFLQ
ncbi:MAG: serine hydrolase [Gemmiger sp.]|nr:serine hydrolase [Gemmiger sp.]